MEDFTGDTAAVGAPKVSDKLKPKKRTKPRSKKAKRPTKAKKKRIRKIKKVGVIRRPERLDLRLTRAEKAKIVAESKKHRRTFTSLVLEALGKIK